MRWIIIILFIVSCHKDEPFDRSFYLHGGDFKVWKQTSNTKTENGQIQALQVANVRMVFYSNNDFAITSNLGNKGLWKVEGDEFTIIYNGVPIRFTVLSLTINELVLESYFQNITYNEIWIPL